MPSRPETTTRSDRVFVGTRVLAVAILPFLVVAAVLLWGFPARTGELFAWAIAPPLSAALLASAYTGGIWFFVRVALERRWHRVQHGFPAVAVFAGALLLATVLHLDRFSSNLSFAVWTILYATTPFAVVAAAVLQARTASRDAEARDLVIPRAAAWMLAAIGGVALAFGAGMFVAPSLAASFWAWDLTPLTAQVTGAVLSLTGVVNAGLLRDRRWSAFRVLFEAQLVSLAAIAVSLVICRADLRWERPMTAVFVILVAGAAVSYGAFFAWCEFRRRR